MGSSKIWIRSLRYGRTRVYCLVKPKEIPLFVIHGGCNAGDSCQDAPNTTGASSCASANFSLGAVRLS